MCFRLELLFAFICLYMSFFTLVCRSSTDPVCPVPAWCLEASLSARTPALPEFCLRPAARLWKESHKRCTTVLYLIIISHYYCTIVFNILCPSSQAASGDSKLVGSLGGTTVQQDLYAAVSAASSWLDAAENQLLSGPVLLSEDTETQLTNLEVLKTLLTINSSNKQTT